MKSTYLRGLLVLAMCVLQSACTTSGEIRPYRDQSASGEIQKGVVFSLPKTILEVSITYSLYERKVWVADVHGNPVKASKDGKPKAPKSSSMLVVVDKPVKISTRTMADPGMRFIFDVSSLDGITKATDITLELTNNGLIKSSNTIVQDKTKEIIANTTGTLVNLAKIAAVAGVDAVEMTHVKDVTVTRIIDPSDVAYTASEKKYSATYNDSEKAGVIFSAGVRVPEVVVRFEGERDISQNVPVKADLITGLPYRTGSPMRVAVLVDDVEIYDQFHMFAQAGGVSFIPINAKAFSDLTQGVTFSDDGTYLSKFSSKGTSAGEAISLAAKEGANTLLAGVKDVDQFRIDKLKKEKELIDAELALAEAKKKQENAQKNEK